MDAAKRDVAIRTADERSNRGGGKKKKRQVRRRMGCAEACRD
eukprot:gene31459-22404_t